MIIHQVNKRLHYNNKLVPDENGSAQLEVEMSSLRLFFVRSNKSEEVIEPE